MKDMMLLMEQNTQYPRIKYTKLIFYTDTFSPRDLLTTHLGNTNFRILKLQFFVFMKQTFQCNFLCFTNLLICQKYRSIFLHLSQLPSPYFSLCTRLLSYGDYLSVYKCYKFFINSFLFVS